MKFIYLHGFASSPASRKAQFFAAKLRAAGADVSVPQLEAAGFGGLTVTGQLRVIAECASAGPVRLIGSSMGGYLAALYASLHAQVEKLVMLAPAFGFAERWSLRLGEAAMREWRETGAREMMHYATGTMEPVGYELIEDGLKYPAEPAFTQPGLIFHGSEDDVVPLEFSERFVAGHDNVKLTVMPSGHELTDVMDEIWRRSAAFLLG